MWEGVCPSDNRERGSSRVAMGGEKFENGIEVGEELGKVRTITSPAHPSPPRRRTASSLGLWAPSRWRPCGSRDSPRAVRTGAGSVATGCRRTPSLGWRGRFCRNHYWMRSSPALLRRRSVHMSGRYISVGALGLTASPRQDEVPCRYTS